MDVTFTSGMTMKRALGLARLFARQLADGQRRFIIETPPTDINRSIELLLAWIEGSLSIGMPVVAMLAGDRRRFVAISGIDADMLYFFSGEQASIRRNDCAVRKGLLVLSATGMFRVRMLAQQAPHNLASAARAFGHKITAFG